MIRSITLALLIVSAALIEASPRTRRDEKVQKYCLKHEDHYNKYCRDSSRLDSALHAKLAKFCPAYEKHCAPTKRSFDEVESDEEDSLVVPPPLPRGGDFAALDLPIGRETSSSSDKVAPVSSQRLTSAIIASCTPDCTLPHCTTECKCAHTHPKVHSMCNPPANSALAATCQRWYSKCTMFSPVSY